MIFIDAAMIAYAAFCNSFRGKGLTIPLPDWDELSDNYQAAWIAAVKSIKEGNGNE